MWRPRLEPLAEFATIRILQCHTDPATARGRMSDRTTRGAHADAEVISDDRYFDNFERLAMPAPSIHVDTTAGYEPTLDRIVEFVNR